MYSLNSEEKVMWNVTESKNHKEISIWLIHMFLYSYKSGTKATKCDMNLYWCECNKCPPTPSHTHTQEEDMTGRIKSEINTWRIYMKTVNFDSKQPCTHITRFFRKSSLLQTSQVLPVADLFFFTWTPSPTYIHTHKNSWVLQWIWYCLATPKCYSLDCL